MRKAVQAGVHWIESQILLERLLTQRKGNEAGGEGLRAVLGDIQAGHQEANLVRPSVLHRLHARTPAAWAAANWVQ